MNCRNTLIAGLAALLSCASAAETSLPLHQGRDAFTPKAAFGPSAPGGSAAAGKGLFLVAWQSGRTAPGDLREGLKLVGDVVACRVSESGKPMDTEPIVVSAAEDQQEDVRVAAGNDVFLVTWQDMRNGKDWDVYAARVSPEGKVLDKDGILIAGGAHNQAKPRLAWDGKNFVVVWQDLRDGKYYALYTARVSPQGQVLESGGVKVASGSFYHCFTPALASAGGGKSFVLHVAAGLPVDGYRSPGAQGWMLEDGKPGAQAAYTRNDKANPKGKEEGKHGPSSRGDPMALAGGPNTYLLAWKNDSSLGRGFGDFGNAALFDGSGKRKVDFSFSGGQGKRDSKRICNPDIVWDGSAFVAAWHEFVREGNNGCPADAVFVQKVSPDGKKQGEALRVSGSFAAPASAPGLASDGKGKTLVVYEKHPAKGDVPIEIACQLLK